MSSTFGCGDMSENPIIEISRKPNRRGEDGYKIVSVRMKDDLIKRLDAIADETNRSRNEIINLLLEGAIDIVKIGGKSLKDE